MSEETLLERLIPGDLEKTIPAKLEQVLPGGFKNRFVQIALGAMISLGLAFIVRRWLEKREAKRFIASSPPAPALPAAENTPPPPEPSLFQSVAAAMTGNDEPEAVPPASRAVQYPLLGTPHIHLQGPVDHAMYDSFREQLTAAPREGPLVIAISTLGGDPEVARLMGDEVRLLREYTGREILFLGKVAVYSAGATFMAAFPVDKRFLTRGTRLMIHERIMNKTVEVAGPLKSCVASLKAALHEIEESVRIEEEGFRDIIAGSKVTFDQVRERAPANWYIEAEEARELGLVLDVI